MKLEPIAFGLLCLFVALLVIGQRFGFIWAGGAGYETPRQALIISPHSVGTIDRLGKKRDLASALAVTRGEIVETGSGPAAFTKIRFDAGTLSLDEHTAVEIVQNDDARIVLNIKKGRVMFDVHRDQSIPKHLSSVSMKTGRVQTTIDHGALSIIHYDFLGRADLWPIDTTMNIVSPADGAFETKTAMRLATDGSFKATPTLADFHASTCAAFYEWVQTYDPFLNT